MATTLLGPVPGSWRMSRDENGYREYEITHKVECSVDDGPANVLQTAGLPLPGSMWAFQDDIDVYAWCKLDAEVTPVVEGDKVGFFLVKQKFTTKGTNNRCKTEQVDDPLLEPDRISGSSVKFTEEATYDRFGDRILNSAHEQIRGPQNEWDNNRHVVKIEQNVPDLLFDQVNEMVDTVNEFDLWGLEPRKIKFSSWTWDKKFRGECESYYVRTLEFEINFKGWDRDLVDEGTKVLSGTWTEDDDQWHRIAVPTSETLNPNSSEVLNPAIPLNPDPDNPSHFIRFKDKNGENARVILNGEGRPFVPNSDDLATEYWWAFVVGNNQGGADLETFYGTCDAAKDYGRSHGFHRVSGPYDDVEVAQVVEDFDGINDPPGTVDVEENDLGDNDFLECDVETKPGNIHVEKYEESDFLTLLIPTEL